MQANLENTSFLVLCGGAGTRMGGQDKPLQPWHGTPMVDHVLRSVPAQLPKLISANRNLPEYACRGQVCVDAEVYNHTTEIGHNTRGPLLGVLAGLSIVQTPWLLIAPGDSPNLPDNWWQHMFDHSAINQGQTTTGVLDATNVVAFDGMRQQHLHVLLHTSVRESLVKYLSLDSYSVHNWLAELNIVQAVFEDADGFMNVNTPNDLV